MGRASTRTLGVVVLAIGSLLLAACGGQAGAFPQRPVELVNPWPAGGSHDAHARVVASSVADHLGQPMLVSIKSGGGGAVGAGFVANDAAADGHTVLLGDQTSVIVRPLLEDVHYTWEDFRPIAQINDSPILFVVPADRPWQTLEEYVEAARDDPGAVNYGSVAGLGPDQIPVELMRLEAGIDLRHVPFEGGGPAYRALLAEDVDMSPLFPATVRQDVEDGRLRALAVTSPERLDEFPDVPTLTELGYDIQWAMFRTVFAPADVPDEAAEQLADAIEATAADEGFVTLIERLGESVEVVTGEELEARVEREAEVLRQLVEQVGA